MKTTNGFISLDYADEKLKKAANKIKYLQGRVEDTYKEGEFFYGGGNRIEDMKNGALAAIEQLESFIRECDKGLGSGVSSSIIRKVES